MTREEARRKAEQLLERNFGDTQRMSIPPDMWVEQTTLEILKDYQEKQAKSK